MGEAQAASSFIVMAPGHTGLLPSLGPQPRTSLRHLMLLLLRRHQIEGGILPLVDTHLAQMTEPDSLSNDRGH